MALPGHASLRLFKEGSNMQDNLERDDFSEEFALIWRQFKISQICLFLGLLAVIAIANCIKAFIVISLVVFLCAQLICSAYFSIRLKCPKCGFHLFRFWWSYLGRGRFSGTFLFGGECPNCTVVLKKRLFPEESQIKLRNRLLVILAVVFILGITGAFIKGNIKIIRQHIELPPSQCR